jgi:hypothetical protein
MKDSSELPLTAYQRTQLQHLRTVISPSSQVILAPTEHHQHDDQEQQQQQQQQRHHLGSADAVTQSTAAEAPENPTAKRTSELYTQLDLARRIRRRLEQSVQTAEEFASEESDTFKVLRHNKHLLSQRRDDVLQLVALTEAVQEGFTLDKYDHYQKFFAKDDTLAKRARQVVRDQVRRLADEEHEKLEKIIKRSEEG